MPADVVDGGWTDRGSAFVTMQGAWMEFAVSGCALSSGDNLRVSESIELDHMSFYAFRVIGRRLVFLVDLVGEAWP